MNRSQARNPHRRGNKDGSERDNGDYLVIEEANGDPDKRFVVVNPLEVRKESVQRSRGGTGVPLWGLAFGERGETRLLVWAQNEAEAFDRCTEWISGRIPGILVTPEELSELMAAEARENPDASEEELQELATADMDHAEMDYVRSSEWGVVYDGSQGSTRDDLYRVAERASDEEFLEEYG